jgi:hypothetical protein
MQLKNRFIAKAGVTIVLVVIRAKPVTTTITVSAVRLLAIIGSNNIRIFKGRSNHPTIKIIMVFICSMTPVLKINMIPSGCLSMLKCVNIIILSNKEQ